MELQAITGQLYIIDGVRQENQAPGLMAQAAPPKTAHSRSKDSLFVHLSLSGSVEQTAVLGQDLLQIINQQFFKTSGSITAAMRKAVLEANQHLLRYNLSQSGPPCKGAVTCSAFRGTELFTLQAGEAWALLGHNFGIERLPLTEPDHITPLGQSSGLDIRYFHHRLQSGDTLLLGDPRLAHLASSDFNAVLVDTPIEEGLVKLADLVGPESGRLLLVEFGTDVPLDMIDIHPPADQPATAVTPTRPPQQSRPTAVSPINRQEVENTARRAGAEAAFGLARFTNWLAELLTRLRPSAPEEEEDTVNWTVPTLIAIIIPLLIAVIVTGVYLQRGQVQQLANVKAEMGQKLGQAQQTADPVEMRRLYNEVLGLAQEADTQLRPGDEQVTQMRQIARDHLDALDQITRLDAALFYQYQTANTNLSAIVLQPGSTGGLYTHDRLNGFVYRHETDETYLNAPNQAPLQLLFEGQAIGNHVAGGIIDMLWRPAGNSVSREGLAMLDSNGALLTFQPGYDNTFAVPLDLSSEWLVPTDIATFDERLYILDPAAQVIWKYFPNGDDFIAKADDRVIAFSEGHNPELDKVVDFDIFSGDGSLVLLYENGRIRYYDTRSGRIQWTEEDLLKSGLNVPLSQPNTVKIIGRGLNASIFIADAGNGRIVQISRPTGQVLAQYRATGPDGEELFHNITSFDVAETPLRIFVTKGDSVYVATQK